LVYPAASAIRSIDAPLKPCLMNTSPAARMSSFLVRSFLCDCVGRVSAKAGNSDVIQV
jgi:hypothetical protein